MHKFKARLTTSQINKYIITTHGNLLYHLGHKLKWCFTIYLRLKKKRKQLPLNWVKCKFLHVNDHLDNWKVCIHVRWSIRPELILVSVAWRNLEYFYSPLDAHHMVNPILKFAGTHLYTWWKEASCPRTLHNISWPGLQSNCSMWSVN